MFIVSSHRDWCGLISIEEEDGKDSAKRELTSWDVEIDEEVIDVNVEVASGIEVAVVIIVVGGTLMVTTWEFPSQSTIRL